MLAVSAIFFNALDSQHFVVGEIANSGHGVVFFLATLILLSMLRPQRNQRATITAICIFATTVGLVIELVQPYFGRNASALDFFYDIIGILGAASYHLTMEANKKNQNRKKTTWLLLGTFCALSLITYPTYKAILLLKHYSKLPTLYSFDAPAEAKFWSLNADSQLTLVMPPVSKATEQKPIQTNANQAALISLNSGKYPGISFHNFYADWSEYKTIILDLFAKTTMELVVRIHDSAHNHTYSDRYNMKLKLTKGANRIEIPLSEIEKGPESRKLDLKNIDNMTLFAISPGETLEFYIDEIRLER